jgi:hypothetical protein
MTKADLASSGSHSGKQRRGSEGHEFRPVITLTEGGIEICQLEAHFINPLL